VPYSIFIPKPFDLWYLLACMKKLLRRRFDTATWTQYSKSLSGNKRLARKFPFGKTILVKKSYITVGSTCEFLFL